MKRHLLLVLCVMGVVAAGCGQALDPTPTAQLIIPTPPTATAEPVPSAVPSMVPTVPVPATPTAMPPPPAASPTPVATPNPTTIPPATETPGPVTFRVVFVETDDVLNVRSGAGVASDVVMELAPGASGIVREGGERLIAGSRWVQIEQNGAEGWVNDYYLTEDVSPNVFCDDPAARQTLDAFIAQVEGRDSSALLAESLAPQRGLRVRHDWWNNEVRLSGNTLSALFTSSAKQDWGTAMGSGEPLEGSFASVIQPLLAQDLVGGTEIACNEILHGGTAGLVQLPDAYEGINYFSVFRPGSDAFAGMDWGTWVVGIERLDGQYVVSYLVHFAWEI